MIQRRSLYKGLCIFIVVAFVTTTLNLECLVFADNFLNTAKPVTVGLPEKLQSVLNGLQYTSIQAKSAGLDSEMDLSSHKRQMLNLEEDLLKLDVQIQQEFQQNREILSEPGMPPEAYQRYDAFTKEYEKRKGEVLKSIAAVEKANSTEDLLAAFGEVQRIAREYTRTNTIDQADVQQLPFRKRETKDGNSIQMASAEIEKELKEFSYEKQMSLSNAPTAEDLAETEEILFHSEIIEAATSLNKDPIRMFRLVADNCYFQPYYGSMKGSLETFRQQAGNDIDLASFLMAMYRYSGIPCRYVAGDIQVPIDQALNYIGVEDVNVMGSVLATQGVPSVIVTNSDTGEQFLRIKHYWVKAWLPSKYRGVGGGESGTWIYLDPSFKQHVFTTGVDTKEVLDQDPATQSQRVESHLSRNSEYSFNFDMSGIRGEMDGHQTQLDAHFAENFDDDSSLKEMMNYVGIVREDFDFLPASLPYDILSTDGEHSAVPSSMKFKATIQLEKNDPYDFFSNGVDLTYTASTAFLAGKRIIVGYVPSTSSDAAVVQRYGGVKNTPASAAYLKPGVRIDGELMKEGSGFGIGEEEQFVISVSGPDGTRDKISNTVAVGSYHSVAFDLQGVAPKQALARVEKLKESVEMINNLIAEASGEQETVTVDRDDIAGEFLSVTGQVYWANMMNFAEYGAMQQNILYVKGVSEAVVSFGLDTEYFFGLPRGVDPSGTGIDVDLNIMTPFNRKGSEVVNVDFAQEYGYRASCEEHSIFDELLKDIFGTTTGVTKKTSGVFLHETEAENYPTVSAVKALRLANEQGMPIYSLDSIDAYNAVSGELALSSNVRADVVNGLNAGRTVVVHQRAVTHYTWHGFGYIITDQDTGDAAYMISSGANGGEADKSKIEGAVEWLFGPGSTGYVIATGLFVLSQFGAILGPATGIIGAVWSIVNLIIELKAAEASGKYCPQAKEALIEVLIMFSCMSAILSIIGIFVGPLMAFVIFIMGIYLSLAIDILKAILPVICNYLDALNSVKVPEPIRIFYGYLLRLNSRIGMPPALAG